MRYNFLGKMNELQQNMFSSSMIKIDFEIVTFIKLIFIKIKLNVRFI